MFGDWGGGFQTLMKGPRVLFIASLIEPTTVLVADLVCVLACESQVFSGMCLSHPQPRCVTSCKCCICCILLVIILVLLRCIFIKQIFTESIVLLLCCSESSFFLRGGGELRAGGWGGGRWSRRWGGGHSQLRQPRSCSSLLSPASPQSFEAALQALCGREAAATATGNTSLGLGYQHATWPATGGSVIIFPLM